MVPRNNERILRSEKRIFLSLGSNLGDRLGNLKKGFCKLEEKFIKNSCNLLSFTYETEAWGMKGQTDFLNQILILQTTESNPKEILKVCQEIENELGRVREVKWGPRIIDIDILFFENEIVNEKDLVIPHPEIPRRRFILTPLLAIAPDFIHPILNKSISQLYEECTDALSVKIYSLENFVNHKN